MVIEVLICFNEKSNQEILQNGWCTDAPAYTIRCNEATASRAVPLLATGHPAVVDS